MKTSRITFLAARLEASNVVPPSESPGSGTAVFLFSEQDRRSTLAYQLTYATLASPDVRSITLRNFGTGKEGRIVHVICGQESQKCHDAADSTLRGSWSSEDSRMPLTPDLWAELANRRIYIEIETARGKEIRSQLGASPFMVMAREAQVDLHGLGESEGTSGTAALRLVQIRGQMQLGVVLTVAGAREDPTSVALVDKANRFAVLRLQRPKEMKSGRTLRIASTALEFKVLSDPRFVSAFAANELMLEVFLGGGQRSALRGQVNFVR